MVDAAICTFGGRSRKNATLAAMLTISSACSCVIVDGVPFSMSAFPASVANQWPLPNMPQTRTLDVGALGICVATVSTLFAMAGSCCTPPSTNAVTRASAVAIVRELFPVSTCKLLSMVSVARMLITAGSTDCAWPSRANPIAAAVVLGRMIPSIAAPTSSAPMMLLPMRNVSDHPTKTLA